MLAYPSLEDRKHRRSQRRSIGRARTRLRERNLRKINAEAAFGSDPEATPHPDAGADMARNHRRNRRDARETAHERNHDTAAFKVVADEAYRSTLAYVIDEQARRPMAA